MNCRGAARAVGRSMVQEESLHRGAHRGRHGGGHGRVCQAERRRAYTRSAVAVGRTQLTKLDCPYQALMKADWSEEGPSPPTR